MKARLCFWKWNTWEYPNQLQKPKVLKFTGDVRNSKHTIESRYSKTDVIPFLCTCLEDKPLDLIRHATAQLPSSRSVCAFQLDTPNEKRYKCWYSKSLSHWPDTCPKFPALSIDQRIKVAKENHVCLVVWKQLEENIGCIIVQEVENVSELRIDRAQMHPEELVARKAPLGWVVFWWSQKKCKCMVDSTM